MTKFKNLDTATRIQFNCAQDIDELTRDLVENASGQTLESLDIGDVNAFLNDLIIFHETEDEDEMSNHSPSFE